MTDRLALLDWFERIEILFAIDNVQPPRSREPALGAAGAEDAGSDGAPA